MMDVVWMDVAISYAAPEDSQGASFWAADADFLRLMHVEFTRLVGIVV